MGKYSEIEKLNFLSGKNNYKKSLWKELGKWQLRSKEQCNKKYPEDKNNLIEKKCEGKQDLSWETC